MMKSRALTLQNPSVQMGSYLCKLIMGAAEEDSAEHRDYFTAPMYGMAVITMILAYCDVPSLGALSQTCVQLHTKVITDGRVSRWERRLSFAIICASHTKHYMNMFMVAAIDASEVRLVHVAIRYGADVKDWFEYDRQTGDHTSAFEWAARTGSMELIELFIDEGCYLRWGLWGVCWSGNMALVDWFLNEKKVDLVECSYFAMDRAGRGGHSELLKYLLKRMDDLGASVCEREKAINAGLSGSCFGGHQSVAEELLALGADDLISALENAILGQHFELVRWLKHEKKWNDWGYAICAAARIGSMEWVDYFIKKTKADGKGVNYESPLWFAERGEQDDMVAHLESLQQADK